MAAIEKSVLNDEYSNDELLDFLEKGGTTLTTARYHYFKYEEYPDEQLRRCPSSICSVGRFENVVGKKVKSADISEEVLP